MIEIPLTRGYVTFVDDIDHEVSAHKWMACVQGRAPNLRVYAVRQITVAPNVVRTERLHRVIWQRAHGPLQPGAEIDHREPGPFGGLDNRRENLRLCDKSLNQANSRKGSNNTSGYKGVWWQKQAGLWRADIWVDRRKRHIGYFTNPKDAALAYDAEARRAFGEHARVNFPERAA